MAPTDITITLNLPPSISGAYAQNADGIMWGVNDPKTGNPLLRGSLTDGSDVEV